MEIFLYFHRKKCIPKNLKSRHLVTNLLEKQFHMKNRKKKLLLLNESRCQTAGGEGYCEKIQQNNSQSN